MLTMCDDGACADLSSDPLHCNSCDTACTAPENGVPICTEGACDFECEPGYMRVIGTCVTRTTPRPIAPLSTATVTSRRPTLRWELGDSIDGARVQLCADRACASVIETIDATGTSAQPTSDLPVGVVFWRLFGRAGTDVGAEPSPTWQFYVGARSAPVDTSWGTILDVNGDGFADLAVGAHAYSSFTGRVYVYVGGPSGLGMSPAFTLTGRGPDGSFGASVASAGDVNGDGFADLVVGAPHQTADGQVYVFLGGGAGLAASPLPPLVGSTSFGGAVAAAGDIDGDGYGDLIVGAPSSVSIGRAHVYPGGPNGPGVRPAHVVDGPDGVDSGFGGAVASAGDVDGDGMAEFVVGAYRAASAAGRVHVYFGSATGLSFAPTQTLNGTGVAGARFGRRRCRRGRGRLRGGLRGRRRPGARRGVRRRTGWNFDERIGHSSRPRCSRRWRVRSRRRGALNVRPVRLTARGTTGLLCA
jgi:hypothetical protein